MLDLNKGTDKLDAADGFLTKLKGLLKKHWGILILCLVVYFFYWALTSDFEEPVVDEKLKDVSDPSVNTPEEKVEYYVIKEEYFIDDYGYRIGDTVYVDFYNDGSVEQYYTDGETYYEN